MSRIQLAVLIAVLCAVVAGLQIALGELVTAFVEARSSW